MFSKYAFKSLLTLPSTGVMNIQDVFFVKYHQERSFGFWRVVVVTASILNLEFVAPVKEDCDYVTQKETLLVPEFLIAHCYARAYIFRVFPKLSVSSSSCMQAGL